MRVLYLRTNVTPQCYYNSYYNSLNFLKTQTSVEAYDRHKIKLIKSFINVILNKVKTVRDKTNYLIKLNILSYDLQSCYAALLHENILQAVRSLFIYQLNDRAELVRSCKKKRNKKQKYSLLSVLDICKNKLKSNLISFIKLKLFSSKRIRLTVITFPFLLNINSKTRGNKK